jgi:hypothetical protein
MAAASKSPAEIEVEGWHRVSSHVPRVVSESIVGDRAEVVLEVEPGYEEWCYYVWRDEAWTPISSGNGPTEDWSDPSRYRW